MVVGQYGPGIWQFFNTISPVALVQVKGGCPAHRRDCDLDAGFPLIGPLLEYRARQTGESRSARGGLSGSSVFHSLGRSCLADRHRWDLCVCFLQKRVGAILVFALILYVAYLPARPSAVDYEVAEKRRQAAAEVQAAGLAKITGYEVNTDTKAIQIPIEAAMDLIVTEYQTVK